MSTSETTEYIDYPYIKSGTLEKREYQTRLADAAITESTLIALPTGTGKTIVAALSMAHQLKENEDLSGKRILMLAPTKPLVEQHVTDFREWFDFPDHEVKMFTGDTRPDERETLWDEPSSIVVATPQVIENDLIAGRITLDKVVQLIFDECHRATGDYAYNYIAERYWQQAERPLVTGLSASPGSNEEEILEVCENLGLTGIEVLTEEDDTLSEHTAETNFTEVKVDLDGDYEKVNELLKEPYTEVLKELKDDLGVLYTRDKSRITSETIRGARGDAREMINNDNGDGYRAMSLLSEARKFNDAIEAVTVQGMEELERKFDKWEQEADSGQSKAVSRFLKRPNVKEARRIAKSNDEPHPKMKQLRPEVVRTLADDGQALVFVDTLRMADRISDFLSNDMIDAHKFVGQQGNDQVEGMSQSRQAEVIEEFKNGKHDILVATSVAEEGLDIPSVDLVAIYEPSGQAIRKVQQSGRTGRQSEGKVTVFMTKGSADEGRYYKSLRNERKMKDDLKELKEMEEDLNERLGSAQADLSEFTTPDATEEDVISASDVDAVAGESSDTSDDSENEDALDPSEAEFDESSDQIVIYADNRETKSSVVKTLSKNPEIDLRMEQLEVGDYIVSDRCAMERKSAEDFKSTLTGGDRDLFEQLGEMRSAYDTPVLLLEGQLDEFFSHGVHPNAVRGTIAAVILGMDTAPLHSRDEDETAEYIYRMAKREQEERNREVSAHGSKSAKTLSEQQVYIVSSIIDVGPVTAKNLLEHFGSVREVMDATKVELMQVENIGESTAKHIVDTVTAEYEG